MFQATFIWLFSAVVLTALPAQAATSDWFETTGGKIRLVVSEASDDGRTMRGALQIALEPGWKTYWRDPGASGIPPQVELLAASGIGGVEIGFPPPHRFDDSSGSWAGYKHSTDFALTFERTGQALPEELAANVFVGICETICVPVQARLTIDLTSRISDAVTEQTVMAAFAALPGQASEDFGLNSGQLSGETIIVDAHLPDETGEPVLFIEAPAPWYFGVPTISAREPGRVTFQIPLAGRPEGLTDIQEFAYTLTSGSQSVSGMMPVTGEPAKQ